MAVRVGAGLALLLAAAAAGPQGFSSLKIAPGVREAGMGGTGCASAIGPQAVAWNPAATADAGSFAAVAGYTKWLLDTRQQSLFLSRGLGGFALGAGVSSFAAGSFEYREEVPTGEPLGTFEPVELTVYLNASRPVGPAGRPVGSLGASVRYFYSKITASDAGGFGLDVGARLRPLPGLVLGASVVDFGQTMTYRRDRAWLPTRARFGACYGACLAGWRLALAADGSYYVYSREYDVRAGVEVAPVNLLQLRAGYALSGRAGDVSFGVGLRPGRFLVDYSLAPLRYDLGAAHRFSIGLGL